jgi:hypothetical protein
VSRLLSAAARAGLGLCLGLIVMAVSRWAPVEAAPLLDVRALPIVPWALACAVVAALTARERRPTRWRPLAWAWIASAALLALAVALRPAAGLEPVVRTASGVTTLAPGPVDLTHGDLLGWGAEEVSWRGEWRAPQSGRYGLRVEGRGRVTLRLDGRTLVSAEAEQLREQGTWLVGRGAHVLEIDWALTGSPEARGPAVRGHRLRLSWVRPRRNGNPGGVDEVIPARALGTPLPAAYWWATDALAALVALLTGLLAASVPWERPARRRAAAPLGRRELSVSIVSYAVLAVVMSWPLALDLAHRGVLYRDDGRLNTWILAWVAHALWTEPGRLFQAPIFHPAPDALAFSENLLVPGILAAPASLAGEPVLGYNLVFLLSALAGGLGVQLLVRRVSGDPVAAFAAGVLFAFGAHRWARMAHLHAHVGLFIGFALLALERFHERRSWRRGLVVGLLLGLQGLSSVYLGAITGTLVAIAAAAGLFAGWGARGLARLLAGLALAAALLLPVAAPYFRMREANATEWSLAEVAPHEVTLESYLASGSRLWSGVSERHLDPERVRQPLFPGVVMLALGIAGLASAPRRLRAVALAITGVGLVISLGAGTPVYPWLHENVVVFRGVRALGRFALLPVVALAVLSGLALSGRRRLALALTVVGLVEAASVPIRYEPYEHPRDAARWLAGRSGAVLDWPLGERDTHAMLEAIAHFRPLVNGYSGYTPRHYAWLAELLDDPASPEALRYLRAVDVTHVVARDELALPLAARFGDERVYAVPGGEAARAPAPGQPVAVHWRDADGGSVTVDLGAVRAVSRVVFPLGEQPWRAPPRLARSLDGRDFEAIEDATFSLADAALSLARRPLEARAEIRFGCRETRLLRLEGPVPRAGTLEVEPLAACPAPVSRSVGQS